MRRVAGVFWRVALASLLTASAATGQRMDFKGEEEVGWVYLIPEVANVPGVPLLDHFDLGYERDDHHVLVAQLFPPIDGFVGFVGLRDDQLSTFHYDVGWRLLVPAIATPTIANVSGRCERQRCTAPLDEHPDSAGGIFVLVGFRLKFENGDHHVDVIEVREDDQELIVEFADKNGDDPFSWDVEFTYLPESLVHGTGTVRGRGAGEDSSSSGMSSDVVIAGFRFDFREKDHHIRDFAVDVRDGHTVFVKYNDKNSDDEYDWIVDLVELN